MNRPDDAGRRVAVTGANGFVGSALVEYLASAGCHVTAIVRKEAHARRDLPGISWGIVPDLASVSDLHDALRDQDAVVHLVAKTHDTSADSPASWAEYVRTNVALTTSVMTAAIHADAGRFVYLSSIKSVTEVASDPVSEDHPRTPEDAYGHTKAIAEEIVEHLADSRGMDFAILRPPLVYGPGVKGNMAKFARAARRGLPLPIGGVRNRRSMISIDNLCSAIHSVVRHPERLNSTFHVCDPEPISTKDLYKALLEGFGHTPRTLPVPASMLRFAGLVSGQRPAIRRLVGDLVLDRSRIREVVGWEPDQTTHEGIRHMVESMHDSR